MVKFVLKIPILRTVAQSRTCACHILAMSATYTRKTPQTSIVLLDSLAARQTEIAAVEEQATALTISAQERTSPELDNMLFSASQDLVRMQI
jgi:hypothetical protein